VSASCLRSARSLANRSNPAALRISRWSSTRTASDRPTPRCWSLGRHLDREETPRKHPDLGKPTDGPWVGVPAARRHGGDRSCRAAHLVRAPVSTRDRPSS
jgi:hypothetical protein